MNITFFIFWLIIFILIGVLIYLTYENVKGIKENSQNPYNLTTSALQSCYPKSNIELLPTVTSNKSCIINGGSTTKYRFQNTSFIDNAQVLVDIAPLPFLQACEPFCTSYDILQGVCDDDPVINPQYNECVNSTKPVQGCLQSALPIARLNETPYYLAQKSFSGCT